MARRRALLSALLAVGTLAAAACASDAPAAAPAAPPDHWTRVTLGRPFDEKAARVDSVLRVDVANTGLWLALGSGSDRPGALIKPAAWASSDDRNWRSIGMPVDPADVGTVSTAASFGATGLVGGEIGAESDAVPAVWTSSTGWEWSSPIRLPLPTDHHGVVVTGISHGPGGWVAVGGPVTGGSSPPIFWYSADGAHWALGDAGSFGAGLTAVGVAATGDRYVATVSSADPDQSRRSAADGASPPPEPAVILSSADGHTWQRAPLDAIGSPTVIGPVIWIRDWFATPIDCCGPDQRRLAVSRDGTTWQPGLDLRDLPGLDAVSPLPQLDLHDRGGRLVVSAGAADQLWMGQTAADQDLGDASVPAAQSISPVAPPPAPADPWMTSAPGTGTARVATAGPTILVVRPGGQEVGTYWTASDDGNWGRAVTDIPPPVRQWTEAVQAMTAAGGTVVAVGHATYRSPARTEGRAWFSTGSLLQWDEVIVNGDITDLVGVATDGKHFVAIGAKGDRPVVLRSVDGRAWDEIDVAPPAPGTTVATGPLGLGSSLAPVFAGQVPTAIVTLGGSYVVSTESGALWSSPDGLVWTAVPVGDDPAIGGAQRGPLSAATGFGVDVPFRSTNGSTWTADAALQPVRADLCAVAANGATLGLAAGDTGLSGWLAGSGQPSAATVDTSGLGAVDGLFARGPGWLAVGATAAGDGEGDPGVWSSDSGTGGWTPMAEPMQLVAEPGPGALSASLAASNRLLLGGTANDAATVLIGPS